jgi:5-formyltetrahydrofolate cyclo-ligase
MRKAKVRKQVLEARRSLKPGQVEEKAAAILTRLQSLPALADGGPVLSYVASKDNEVDTLRLITWLLEQGRVVLVPIALADRTLEWSRLLSLSDLSRGRFDILEPRPERRRIEVPPLGAVVIVPGVAFRPDGYRIGYGAGYFDRFLSAHRGTRIGLAFDVQIVESFVPDPHDIPMDYIVTETRVLQRP